ncbi:MAG: dipicolinate synthase subunit B [Clostridiaceae bacterium]|jgi:dipicolinate synthase subunit B|nr:dipicolinate synthase subunit B [Clostridiaceae bacterium]
MKRIGLAITGSFCTFGEILKSVKVLKTEDYDIIPILSYHAAQLNTKFYNATDFTAELEDLCGNEAITTIVTAEPIGTSMNLELVIVAPCTGNTLSKIANGITDTPVTMAVKAQLRNSRPVLIAISSNDALGANAKNLGALLNTKNVYFVPFKQDNPQKKTNSLIADLSLLPNAVAGALNGRQPQPLFL